MTKQDVIDKIVKVFVDEDTHYSVDISSQACYYGKRYNNVGCFVGMFMPTDLAEELDEKFPGACIRTLCEVYTHAAVFSFIENSGLPLNFWAQLQMIHDQTPNKELLKNYLEIKLKHF